MRITDQVYLVGSGSSGFNLTFHSDSHIYLIDGGNELARVDAELAAMLTQKWPPQFYSPVFQMRRKPWL